MRCDGHQFIGRVRTGDTRGAYRRDDVRAAAAGARAATTSSGAVSSVAVISTVTSGPSVSVTFTVASAVTVGVSIATATTAAAAATAAARVSATARVLARRGLGLGLPYEVRQQRGWHGVADAGERRSPAQARQDAYCAKQ